MALIGDLLKAIGQLSDRRFLGVLLTALGITIALLFSVAAGAAWAVGFLPDPLFSLPWIGDVSLPLTGLQGLAIGGVLLASSFLMFPVAAIFVGLFLDRIADAVEDRHYPAQKAARSPSLIEGLKDGLGFAGVMILANLAALILYAMLFWLGPVNVLIFWAMNGYLLGREFFQMVAIRHLPLEQAAALRKRNRFRIWLAGTLMAVPLTIPVLNLIIPILGVATVTHQYHRLART
ncbi:MAG: EI24 domain-containing protein [Pseudomonadota bacterium]